MDLSILTDPIFRAPLVVGLLLACVLPLLGAILMLRGEWLAALGFAQLAAAGTLLGLAIGLPPLSGGLAAAAGAAIAKGVGRVSGNTAYGFMILGGWAALLLIAANSPHGELLGNALVEGQLYFAGRADLTGALLLALISAMALPWLMPRLLRARLLPQYEAANRLPAWRWHLGFDLLVAGAMAVATASMGLMAAFALVLVPAWIAFRIAIGWRRTLAWSSLIGLLAYLSAFTAALLLDQPFGPSLVMVLLLCALASLALTTRRQGSGAGRVG
jgi:zinc/manganese transport system permease protein